MISYDDVQSVTEKCWYVNAKGLGGIMFWDLTGDIRSGQPASLLDTINTVMYSNAVPSSPRPISDIKVPPSTNPDGSPRNPNQADSFTSAQSSLIGAIIGGVIAGIVVLAIGVFIFWKRAQSHKTVVKSQQMNADKPSIFKTNFFKETVGNNAA